MGDGHNLLMSLLGLLIALGAALAAIGLAARALVTAHRAERRLVALVDTLVDEAFAEEAATTAFADRVAVLIPAYDEQDALGPVLRAIPIEVAGVRTAVLVVDDGSSDATGSVARAHGATVVRHHVNRGGGAALRTGYRLLSAAGARVIVTLDADGQHRPAEMERLVAPIVSGRVDVTLGSRVLGHAEPGQRAREIGVALFARVVSRLAHSPVSDPSNAYRAIRVPALRRLHLHQEQFHSSEFVMEAHKRGLACAEVPVSVVRRTHGHSKKPPTLRYGLGFATAIVRTWLR